jgi:serine/threonine-protein kinase
MKRLAGRYQLVRELATHDRVRVYQAVDTQSGMPVLVKTMQTSGPENIDAFIRFQQEGVVLSTLRHQNIWEVKGTFLEEGMTCIVLEYVDGQPLSELVADERLTLSRLKVIMRQVASALAYAHERGIIHRDINPENIVVAANDRVKLRDMVELGLARVVRAGATPNTSASSGIGTPLYLAPEQIKGEAADGRTDIYALGAVLYHVVTGHAPFEGKGPVDVMRAHVETQPRPPRELNPSLPPDWDALILKMLAKDPAKRLQTAAELESSIAGLSEGGSVLQDGAPREVAAGDRKAQPGEQVASGGGNPLGAVRCPKCGRESRGKFCGACGTRLVPG